MGAGGEATDTLFVTLIKIQPDARVCRYLFTAKLLYMFDYLH